jgi:2-polyprenyl-3-methyl-5-hydroxy-6-metoxy-1,4-benzoquinol methylase
MTELLDVASYDYRKVLESTHEGSKWGNGGKHHIATVMEWGGVLEAASILDYGCGRGSLKKVLLHDGHIHPEFDIREYDPGVPKKSRMPAPADLVVCTDVLEHVEPDYLNTVLQHIFDLSLKGAYLLISCRPAKTILADGRNAHLIVQSHEWWYGTVSHHSWMIERSEHKVDHSIKLWLRKG